MSLQGTSNNVIFHQMTPVRVAARSFATQPRASSMLSDAAFATLTALSAARGPHAGTIPLVLQPRQPHQVVTGDLQADHPPRAFQPDRAQALAALLGQPCERVLAERAVPGNPLVAALLGLAQRFARMPVVLDVGAIALAPEVGLAHTIGIRTVGADRALGVGRIQDRLEVLAVVHVSRADLMLADEAPAPVRVGVQLVAVERLAVLVRPARRRVLLRALGRAPAPGHLALLDGRVLLARVALDRCVDDAGVDDLAATDDEAGALQLAAHRSTDVADQILLLEPLAPHPDRLGVRDPAAVLQAQEALEAGAIQYWVFQRVIGQVVQLLQQQQLDHHHRWIRRPAAAPRRAPRQLGIHHRCDRIEVDVPGQQRQRIVEALTLGVAFFAGEQADHR